MNFEVFEGRNGEWFFKIVARNGEPVAHSEGYKRWRSAVNTAKAIRDNVGDAEIDIHLSRETLRYDG